MTKHTWTVLARHKWVSGATITESVSDDGERRRFTATIRGSRNWRIYEGAPIGGELIADCVAAIRDQIDGGNQAVFTADNQYATDRASLSDKINAMTSVTPNG